MYIIKLYNLLVSQDYIKYIYKSPAQCFMLFAIFRGRLLLLLLLLFGINYYFQTIIKLLLSLSHILYSFISYHRESVVIGRGNESMTMKKPKKRRRRKKSWPGHFTPPLPHRALPVAPNFFCG